MNVHVAVLLLKTVMKSLNLNSRIQHVPGNSNRLMIWSCTCLLVSIESIYNRLNCYWVEKLSSLSIKESATATNTEGSLQSARQRGVRGTV